MGWSNLLLRKQLFKAFDLENHGDLTFTEFCEGYSTMLRGTVPELLEFAWRVYHIQGNPNVLSLTDVSLPTLRRCPVPHHHTMPTRCSVAVMEPKPKAAASLCAL